MYYNKLKDSNIFGVASLEAPYIALDLDENPFTGENSQEIKNMVLTIVGIDLKSKICGPVNIDFLDGFIKTSLIKLESSNEAAVLLSYITGYVHEMRHYHDLVSTNFGTDLLFQSISQFFNTSLIFVILCGLFEDDKINKIRLPIHSYLNEEEIMKEFEKTDLKYFLSRAELVNDRKKDNWNINIPQLTTANMNTLFELSAVCAQLEFAYEIYGEKGFNTIYNILSKNFLNNDYLEGIEIVKELRRSNGFNPQFNLSNLSMLTWFSLQGIKKIENKYSEMPSPIIIWEYLTSEFSRSQKVDVSLNELLEFYKSKINVLDVIPWEDNFISWNKILNDRIKQYKYPTHFQIEYFQEIENVIIKSLNSIIKNRSFIYEGIAKNLNYYFGLQSYGWSVLTSYMPRPTLILKYDNEIIIIEPLNSKGEQLSLHTQLYFWEGVHNLLTKGRCNGSIQFIEEYIFNELRNGNYGGKPLKFWLS